MDQLYTVEIIPTDDDTPYALTVATMPEGVVKPEDWLLNWAKEIYGAGATIGWFSAVEFPNPELSSIGIQR